MVRTRPWAIVITWATQNEHRQNNGIWQCESPSHIERQIMLGTILLILLILMLVGAFPTWPHSRGWGYYPTGGLGLALMVVVILVLLGRI